MTRPMLPKADNQTLAVFARNGAATLRQMEVHELRSIWPAALAQKQ